MTRQPLKTLGFALFFLSLAVFLVYHVSHGFPGLNLGTYTMLQGVELIDY